MQYLDAVFVTRNGRQQDLWRTVDEDGDVLDILVQSRSDRRADGRSAGSRRATVRNLGHRKNQPSATPTNRQNAMMTFTARSVCSTRGEADSRNSMKSVNAGR